MRAQRAATGVHQGKAAGAVGVFRLARRKAALPEQGGLLVAGGSRHGDARQSLRTPHAGLHIAVNAAVGHGAGQHLHGHPQSAAKFLVPAQPVDVKEHGAGAVGIIRNMLAGEVPDEPAVHRAAQQLAPLGPGPGAGNVIQNPGDLGAGKISVDQKTGGLADVVPDAALRQTLAFLRRAAALPDDGVHNGFSGVLFPDHGGLPLVGDADGGDLRRGKPGPLVSFGQRHQLGPEDLHGVMLHPSGSGIVLGKGILPAADDLPLFGKDDGAGAGGALIQSDDVHRHSFLLRSLTD